MAMRLVVPHQDRPLQPPAPDRVRRFKRHLIECLRELRKARRPDRLIQALVVPVAADVVPVLVAGCTACRGFCCLGGGEHAYIDERTLARIHRDQPALTGRGMIAAYVQQIAPRSFADSCLFHGETGCTLRADMRARLCHSFFCSPLKEFLRGAVPADEVTVVPGPAGWDGGRVPKVTSPR
ncbi:hypothetical protein [Rhodopila sp.]|uniref:hypothetical protein n=1 Tax=Rhodopila sp. TaxID=2480087 RepID=UPI002BA6994D|nr:hypothetical protein [Rhodopila sp.]HVZ06798.1 hypothetical protein [Rhodopila sp.]